MSTRTVDPVSLEVVHNRLEAIVEEMGITMLKTAHSSIFVEARDYSVALFTRAGELLSMGEYIPHHQGGMERNLDAILGLYPAAGMVEGDVFLINDAYMGGTHPQDINVLAPLFVDGELELFAGCAAHHVDLGGITPGGYAPTATDTYQEGLILPGVMLARAGVLQDDILRLFTRNVRLPVEQKGDLLGQVASLHTARRRVPEVVRRHGSATFRSICEHLLDLTESRVRAEIATIPDGTYEVVDHIDHDGHTDHLYRMKVAMTVKGSEVTLDFTGTDDQAPGFINASYSNTRASAFAAFMLFLDPGIPHNHGFFRPITVIAPEGCLLNPIFPAPLTGSTTECGGRVYDLVLGALSKAVPDRGIGTWSMMMTGCTFNGVHPETGRPYVHWMLEGLATGGGGRANADGWNASNLTSSNCLLPNVEIEEQRYPVRFIRRELVPDSGGAGRHRGGLACEGEVEVEVDCRVSVFGSRGPQCPPPGFLGGEPGAPAGSYVRGADGTVRPLPTKVADVSLKAGDRLVVRACGGGGYGPAADRAPELVEEDLAGGYVTEPGLGPYSPGRPA